MIFTRQFLCSLFCFACVCAYTQENILFHRITTQEGLSNDVIKTVYRDSRGFLWIGTNNGLCKYDGNSISIIRKTQNDSTALVNDIQSIFEDENNNIWIGSFLGGINRIDEKNNVFVHLKTSVADDALNKAMYISNQLVIADGSDTIKTCSLKNGVVKFLKIPPNNTKKNEPFLCYRIFIDQQQNWILTGNNGIIKYTPHNNTFDIIPDQSKFTDLINFGTWEVCTDGENIVWLATENGLFQYNSATKKISYVPLYEYQQPGRKIKFIKCILRDDDGSLWLGTMNGLLHYFPSSGNLYVYRNDPFNNSSLSNNNINTLYKDQQGILWVGTLDGLNAVYPKQKSFDVYQTIPGNRNSIKSNTTGAAFKDKQNNVWVGTQYGLEVINSKDGTCDAFRYFDPHIDIKESYHVMSISNLDSTRVWLGTWGSGLQLFDYRRKQFETSYYFDENGTGKLSSNYIVAISEDDSANNLWMATWNGGIDKLNFKTGDVTVYNKSADADKIPSNYIGAIFCSQGKIWAGCGKGLLFYDNVTDKFKKIDLECEKYAGKIFFVRRISSAGKDALWLATSDGLIRYNFVKKTEHKIKTIGNIQISGMYVENETRLWLGTEDGLKFYDVLKDSVITYTQKDGLPSRNFPTHCYFQKSDDGEIFVNSINGLVHFYPNKIHRNTEVPPIAFTSIKIQNKALPGSNMILDHDSLRLNYDQGYITISFAALNLVNPYANEYAYMMSGIDKDWVYSNNRNEAIYTNLSPGDYTFKVKASNDAGLWNNQAATLFIHISKPWWKTWWFYGLCLLTVVGVLYMLYNIRINRIKHVYKMRTSIARDLHDEVGSTLTSIHILSKVSGQHIENDTSKAKHLISEITEQSQQMQQNMSDIVWAINPENDKLENILVRMREYVARTLEPKNITINFSIDEQIEKETLTMQQRRDLLLIFKEAVNNIAKYSEADTVIISLAKYNASIEMKITDNGKGFDPHKTVSSNGMKNMKARAVALDANFRINTSEGNGTTIYLKMPLHKPTS